MTVWKCNLEYGDLVTVGRSQTDGTPIALPRQWETFIATVHPDDRGKVEAGAARALGDGVPLDVTCRYVEAYIAAAPGRPLK